AEQSSGADRANGSFVACGCRSWRGGSPRAFGVFLQTEGNLSRVNDILYDARARLWDEVVRCSEYMRSHRVSHVPDPFGDRPSGMLTLLHAPWKPASSRRRPLHVETTMHVCSHYM